MCWSPPSSNSHQPSTFTVRELAFQSSIHSPDGSDTDLGSLRNSLISTSPRWITVDPVAALPGTVTGLVAPPPPAPLFAAKKNTSQSRRPLHRRCVTSPWPCSSSSTSCVRTPRLEAGPHSPSGRTTSSARPFGSPPSTDTRNPRSIPPTPRSSLAVGRADGSLVAMVSPVSVGAQLGPVMDQPEPASPHTARANAQQLRARPRTSPRQGHPPPNPCSLHDAHPGVTVIASSIGRVAPH